MALRAHAAGAQTSAWQDRQTCTMAFQTQVKKLQATMLCSWQIWPDMFSSMSCDYHLPQTRPVPATHFSGSGKGGCHVDQHV